MTKIAWLLLFAVCGGPALAGEAVEAPERLQIKDQMQGLTQAFQALEGQLGKKPPDYDALLKTLEEMTERARIAKSLKSSGHPGKDFQRLFRDLEDFKKTARARNASGMEDSMSRLAENCFRCHLTHADRPGGQAVPSKESSL